MTFEDGCDGFTGAGLRLPKARLVCLTPDLLTGRPTELVANVIEGRIHDLGSDRRCDVVLAAPDIAPRHARLVPSLEHWRIAAVDGAFVSLGGRQVATADLRPGSEVMIGPLAFRFEELPGGSRMPETPALPPPTAKPRRTSAGTLWGGALAIVALIGGAVAWQFDWPEGGDARLLAPTAAYRQILEGTSSDMRVLRYDGNEAILVLDFPTLTDQGRMLNRIAALVEKAGAPRDRLLTDAELTGYIRTTGSSVETFYYGHDYRADDLARFFTLAREAGVTLNPDEVRLRRILLEQGAMVETDGGFQAAEPLHAVISIPQVQPDDEGTSQWEGIDRGLRNSILQHELSHGEYFTNAGYREYCARFWNAMLTAAERAAVKAFLEQLGYDRRNEDLMINEMQAFLIHTPDSRIFDAADVGMSVERLAAVKAAFRAGGPPTTLLAEAMEPLPAE